MGGYDDDDDHGKGCVGSGVESMIQYSGLWWWQERKNKGRTASIVTLRSIMEC